MNDLIWLLTKRPPPHPTPHTNQFFECRRKAADKLRVDSRSIYVNKNADNDQIIITYHSRTRFI